MPPVAGMNVALDETAWEAAYWAQVNTVGKKPYATLMILATDPDFQRRGVGRALLEEGLKRVDQMGVACYVQASTMGRPLYEQRGF